MYYLTAIESGKGQKTKNDYVIKKKGPEEEDSGNQEKTGWIKRH